MWDKLTEEAKHQECVGKEYARFRRENSGSGTPSYRDPALAADALSRGYKPQPRSWTPSGGKGGGKSQQQCDRCGSTGLNGTCPAWGKECGFCNGKNHYRAAYRKATPSQKGGGAQPQQKQGKGKSGKSTGKPKAKYAHSVVLKTVPSAKGIVSGMDERASVQNLVTSEPSVPLSKAAKWGNLVLSGNIQLKAALKTHNVFSCDSIHDMGDGTLNQCQTHTDPNGCLCIMTDVLVRARTNSRTLNIRVKADPGADANLMPVHHFRTIFPYLCDSSGQPKEGVLEKAESSFESYRRDSVTVIGQTKIYAMNQQTQQFLITRIYVIARERGPILLSSTACQWLGLIAMLCQKKAPIIGTFVASVTREKTNGREVEAYPIPKTGDSAEMTKSQHQSQRAITAPKETRIQAKKAKSVAPDSEPLDINPETTHSESQPSAPERTETDSS